MDDRIKKYIDSIPQDHRPLFDKLQSVILEVYPDAELKFSYGIVLHKVGKRWVGLGKRKDGITIYTDGPQYVEDFQKKHPKIKGGVGSIKFKPETEVPLEDLKMVVEKAIEDK